MKQLITIGIGATLALALSAQWPNAYQERSITVSNVTYKIQYQLKSTNAFSRPLTNPVGQPHYECTTFVFQGTNRIGIVQSQWTPDGCFEDSPMLLVGHALNWKRFPNDSAGKGFHWVVSGAAEWIESDDK